jgi:hypothetical protein
VQFRRQPGPAAVHGESGVHGFSPPARWPDPGVVDGNHRRPESARDRPAECRRLARHLVRRRARAELPDCVRGAAG